MPGPAQHATAAAPLAGGPAARNGAQEAPAALAWHMHGHMRSVQLGWGCKFTGEQRLRGVVAAPARLAWLWELCLVIDIKGTLPGAAVALSRLKAPQCVARRLPSRFVTNSAPSNSISRVCSRPAGTRIFKNRLFGGLRGRKGRETSRLAMFQGNEKTAVGRGVIIRV